MAFDERARIEFGQRLTDLLGPEVAGYLMEALPPFSWHEVATKTDLLALEERLNMRFDARLHAELNRSIRWTIGTLFGGIAAIGGAAAGIAALVG